jgi:hypothetical protein
MQIAAVANAAVRPAEETSKTVELQTPWPCELSTDIFSVPFTSGIEGEAGAWTQVRSTGISKATKRVGTDHVPLKTTGTSTDKFMDQMSLRVLSSDKKCKAICGVSLALFAQTAMSLAGKIAPRKVLTDTDQLVLYFMKLKTRLSFVALGVIFGIHQRTASKIFSSILNAHFDVAKKHVWWLTKHEVQETMPDSFKLHYPETRVIIDASEVKIQCPRAVDASVLCYSGYKSNHTAKWLVGIAPCGLITFMSRAYGGRVTGKDKIQN